MGKRSDFPRLKSDGYYSPVSVLTPLLPFLKDGGDFIEPCAGDGRLIRWLELYGMRCVQWFDINPGDLFIPWGDALDAPLRPGTRTITNPPWTRQILHPLIDRFRRNGETWLLFDAAWSHTVQARAYLPYCSDIVSVGRVRWIDGTEHSSKDDAAWYRFQAERCVTVFHNFAHTYRWNYAR